MKISSNTPLMNGVAGRQKFNFFKVSLHIIPRVKFSFDTRRCLINNEYSISSHKAKRPRLTSSINISEIIRVINSKIDHLKRPYSTTFQGNFRLISASKEHSCFIARETEENREIGIIGTKIGN